jgi:hypothetical protein
MSVRVKVFHGRAQVKKMEKMFLSSNRPAAHRRELFALDAMRSL